MKILFIGPTRIGDTILSTSIINFYLHRYDDCNFSVITSPFARDIYVNMPRLSKILVVNKKRYGLHWLDIIRFSFFKRWDLVIDLRSSITSYLLNSRTRKIFRGNNNFHKIVQFKKFLNTDEELVPKVWYDAEVSSKSLVKISNSERLIAVAPYSNWSKKDWSIKKYKSLLENEFFKSYTIILTGISNDIRNKKEFDDFLNSPNLKIINLFDWGNLRHMVPIFQKCDFFIGSDSGLMHLSASAGCKTFALFGPTNDLVYGPWGNNTVIRSNNDMLDHGLKNLSVEKVLNSIKENIS